MKRILLLLLAALLTAALGGCGAAAAPAATPAPTAAPTASPTPSPTPTPTPEPTPTPVPTPTPDPEDQYFTQVGEYYHADPEAGKWIYSSPGLFVHILKYRDEALKCDYYVADIRVRDFSAVRSGLSDEKDPGTRRYDPATVSQKHQAVFAQNGDFFTDRSTGIIIRNGTVWRDRPGREDVLAIDASGEMKVYGPKEKDADTLLAEGVQNAFSFGPILIRDGVIQQEALEKHPLRGLNPRSGIGMVEVGHYIAIVADGRQGDANRGMSLMDFAAKFALYDCRLAYNLDGGQSSVICFMGLPINTHEKDFNGAKWATFRRLPEMIVFGTSPSVPIAEGGETGGSPPAVVPLLLAT